MEIITYSHCPCCGSAAISPKISAKDFTVSGQIFSIWQCDVCKVRLTQDVPGQLVIGNYYKSDNYISHSDTKKGIINSLYHLIRKRTLHQKKKLIESYTGMHAGTLLDIGAGTGAFLFYMENAGWKVNGLEPDEATRHRAFELYRLSLKNSGELFKIPSNTFDAVTMWHVLEHVHELQAYIEQLRNVMRKQGKAFIAVPNYTSYDAFVYKEFWAAYDVPRHLYHFSPDAMRLLLQKHGLKLLGIKPMWYDSFYVCMLSEQNKNDSSSYLKAFVNGLISNWKAILHIENCSSLIYIIEK